MPRAAAVAAVVLLGLVALMAGTGVSAPPPDRFDTVVIDAGHGGDDHGALGGRGLLEKELVLDVALRLAERLRGDGLRVVLTRTDDRFVGLEERTSIANDGRGDLFVSIHANAAPVREARGIETYFVSLEASDESAASLARRENLAFGEETPTARPQDPLLAILGDLIATEHLRDSQEFARLAQSELGSVVKSHSRGVKQAPFVVLMGVQMPAALIEVGFVTNPEDERVLRRQDSRDRIADALARAVHKFQERHDARRGIGDGAPAARGGG